jgi:5-methylcytosine-specific restriction endonuclease McrA
MECLVLNADYTPDETISWKKAVFKLLKEKVEVIESHDKTVRTVTLEIKIPSVVRVIRGVHKRKAVKFSRENVYDRDQGRCQYCKVFCTRKEATYDHVIPRALGGQTNWTNIVIACFTCNQRKGGRTPEQAGMRLRTTPIKPKYLPNSVQVIMGWRPGMPEAWKQWLRDVTYWHGKLDET